MQLADQIRAVIAGMPPEDQQVINAAYVSIKHICALADKLGKQDGKSCGVLAAALLGAEYKDAEDTAQEEG